ncbi:DUF167 family protein [Terrarubrum flagellatum]|uniref:DUF167 family protein n=1 Tax=Terrirubrum flagellatum TaxID=2895980 RepID=UPI0031452AE4
MVDAVRPWRVDGEHLLLQVRATPRGGRDAIDGIDRLADERPVLRVRLKAAPVDGEANEGLRRFLAKALGVPFRDVEIASGASSRVKMLRLPAAVAASLERLVA